MGAMGSMRTVAAMTGIQVLPARIERGAEHGRILAVHMRQGRQV